MQRIATTTAITTRPAFSSTGTPGYFTKGNAAAGAPATVVSDDWLNDVQETLLSPIEATGQKAAAGQNDQLLNAIKSLGLIAPYDAALAEAIGGYPLNAVVCGTTAGQYYRSTVAGNTTVPGATGASWVPLWTSSYNGTSGVRTGPDGYTEQWGTVNLPASALTTSSVQITFPQKFDAVCFGVNLTGMNYANTTNGGWPALSMTGAPTLSGVEIIGDTLTGHLSDTIVFNQVVPVFWKASGF
ncbi:bacteriophage tail protein [Komagataeibacter europaeus NBRC 3261]|uniref:Bacteriophage tail protein n=1 Tax=Komagataeibacter europaeus NBRC 3261 TaxID=1234669 RepID=A0A0D6PX58_KOMEU|nr:hypothetical protein [Komagataeibacter europaeus]GAN95345.1 bacteriophage tail protein [Komagataeibacter europaeus NBRC 3261]